MKSLLSLLACMLIFNVARASEVSEDHSAAKAYQYVQLMRKEARNIVKSGNATVEANRKAALHLEGAIAFLDQETNLDLANGSLSLHAKPLDLRLDIAKLYLASNQKEKAIRALEGISESIWFPRLNEIISKDKELSTLLSEPGIQKLIKISGIPTQLYESSDLASPYKDNISTEEKIAGLSLFWARARDSFVHFDKVPNLQWNKVYMEYLSKVMATQTTAQYYRVLMQIAPLLKDGHTNIYPPEQLHKDFYKRPPMRTHLIEDKVIVSAISSPSIRSKLSVGDEIIEIDGMPVKEYAMKKIAPYVSSSTAQDFNLRTFSYQLLSGSEQQALHFRIRSADGKEKEIQVARSGYSDLEVSDNKNFKMLVGDIAYISIDHFENKNSVKAFTEAFPQIKKAKGLIIDVRKNGGGSSSYGLQILSYLTTQTIPSANSYIRADNGYTLTHGPDITWKVLDGKKSTSNNTNQDIYTGPVVVLTGAATFSAAEDFVVSYQLLKRGLTMGETTGGSTGQPLGFDLPGGGSARICVKRDTYPDGSDFVGKGLQADIEVKPTISDIRNGIDPVLNRALQELIVTGVNSN
nr:S41 family peptidase [uncultured Undibacterium sp.]